MAFYLFYYKIDNAKGDSLIPLKAGFTFIRLWRISALHTLDHFTP
jgi:hypothetical protein